MVVLAATYAEGAVNQIIVQDTVISLHTADPGPSGLLNEATGVERETILAADGWSAFADAESGRGVTNALELAHGLATISEDLTHYVLWEIDGTTFILSDVLTPGQTTVVGNPVRFPPGTLALIGRGKP